VCREKQSPFQPHTRGLTKQDARLPWKVRSRHAWLHAIHVLISSALPSAAYNTGEESEFGGGRMRV
jgi:hypothetical protein